MKLVSLAIACYVLSVFSFECGKLFQALLIFQRHSYRIRLKIRKIQERSYTELEGHVAEW